VANLVVVYDACVLYPAPLRDLLLRLALTDTFRARWTDRIHDEWIRAVLASRSDLNAAQLARTRALMDTAIPDALVTGYDALIEQLTLPDPDDRHVLAAAIRAQASVIVTSNLRDFPSEHLRPHGIEVQHPDAFVAQLLDLSPGSVCTAVRDQRQSLKNPPRSVRELLDTFLSLGMASTVLALESMQELI
jgi:predicted nucleic acid-binding protein